MCFEALGIIFVIAPKPAVLTAEQMEAQIKADNYLDGCAENRNLVGRHIAVYRHRQGGWHRARVQDVFLADSFGDAAQYTSEHGGTRVKYT